MNNGRRERSWWSDPKPWLTKFCLPALTPVPLLAATAANALLCVICRCKPDHRTARFAFIPQIFRLSTFSRLHTRLDSNIFQSKSTSLQSFTISAILALPGNCKSNPSLVALEWKLRTASIICLYKLPELWPPLHHLPSLRLLESTKKAQMRLSSRCNRPAKRHTSVGLLVVALTRRRVLYTCPSLRRSARRRNYAL